MSIDDIRKTLHELDNKSKDELKHNVHELLLYIKRQENKMISLYSEIKFYQRYMTKIRDMINKSLEPKNNDNLIWNSKK